MSPYAFRNLVCMIQAFRPSAPPYNGMVTVYAGRRVAAHRREGGAGPAHKY